MVEIRAQFKVSGFDPNQVRLRVARIMATYDTVLGPQLKEEIQRSQFFWPGTTRRRNKTIVTSPRDIVDLGNFLASQRRDLPDYQTLRYTWDAKSKKGFRYSALILTGYVTSTGRIMPPRDWITPALRRYPFDRFFAAEWQREAAGNR